jgi:hypothetical protein
MEPPSQATTPSQVVPAMPEVDVSATSMLEASLEIAQQEYTDIKPPAGKPKKKKKTKKQKMILLDEVVVPVQQN